MVATAPVAVIIPTYGRGSRVYVTLEKIYASDPAPAEVWVHVDQSTGQLEVDLSKRFPTVRVISSEDRLGPGGGRHRCLQQCTTPLAVSFDDDSYPVDPEFFGRVVELFDRYGDAAVIGATIWHRHEVALPKNPSCVRTIGFTGCGHALRIATYRNIFGYVPRPIAYGLEETDVSLQLFAAGHAIYQSGDLRVFHDTELRHHQTPEITECVVANAALLAFLRYPAWLWSWGALQLLSTITYCLRVGRWRGVVSGLVRIPADCIALHGYRQILPAKAIIEYLRVRRMKAKCDLGKCVCN